MHSTGLITIYRILRQRIYQIQFSVIFFLFCLSPAAAVESDRNATQVKLLPIALLDISTRASDERRSLDQAEVLLNQKVVFDQIQEDLLSRDRVITKNLVSLIPELAASSSRGAISEIEQKWLEHDRLLELSEEKLHQRTNIIQQQINRLDVTLSVWKLTAKEIVEAKAPDEIVILSRATADEIDKVYNSLKRLLNQALALQAKAGRSRRVIQEALERIKTEEMGLLNNLTQHERPPLWSEKIENVTIKNLFSNTNRELQKWVSSIVSFAGNVYDRIGFQLFLLLVLTVILHRSRHAARAWSKVDPSVAQGLSVFEKPFALATLIVLMLTPWFYVYTPPALMDTISLLLVFPVLALVLPLLEKSSRPALMLLSILYIVDQFRDLVEAAPLVARFIFILEIIAAIAIIIWMIRLKSWQHDDSKKVSRWHTIIPLGLNSALLLLIVALFASIAGYVRLSVLLGSGVLNSIYLALLFMALQRTAKSVTRLILYSQAVQKINIIKTRTAEIYERLSSLIGLLAVFIWVFVTLDLFVLKDYVMGAIKGILFTELHTGVLTVSLSDVLAFVVTIIAAIILSRFIVLLLDEDVYPRVELGRGVAFAISSVIKYGIILVGFLMAVGAVGVGMDRITILLGAFGVGLGFGLQSVINNFVSGMILIFERPIQLDDSVEVGSVRGRITRIGIRSSTVRSFEGADITVPNGTLLSDALTNWTMSDRNRRIEIPVGVAYGTDLDMVIEVLYGALKGQEGILNEPAPQVIFNGFGDNSLDFLLRAWVADNDEFVSIRSKIALAMSRCLNEHGIEIPFPQRDLHLRSISPDVRLPGNM